MKIDQESRYEAEIARLNKVITVLCDRAELCVSSESSDFSIFQTTVVLEEKVRQRTAELKSALDSLAISNEELDRSLKELNRTQQELVETRKMASLGDLVMGVAHELNTPLGVAITTVSVIEHGCNAIHEMVGSGQLTKSGLECALSDISEAVTLASSNLSRTKNLVSQFKQISAIKGSADLINLPEHIDQLCVVMKDQLPNPNLVITTRFSSSDLDYVVDGVAVHNVLSSLIHNSSQHAFSQQENPSIEIGVKASGGNVEITYKDNGSGFDPAIVGKIFDPFFTTARGAGSVGLGLHIVFNIVTESLGGNIQRVESDQGCIFVISFPGVTRL